MGDMHCLSAEKRGAAASLYERVWRSERDRHTAAVARLHPSAPPPQHHVPPPTNVPDVVGAHRQQDFISLELAATAEGRRSHFNGDAARQQGADARRRLHERDISFVSECEEERAGVFAEHGGCPWLVPGKVYHTGVVGLHEEIEDFYQYMAPSPQEHAMRNCVFERVRAVVLSLWSHAQVHIFGSFETGLYLPTSDIDIVVLGRWSYSPLDTLKTALIRAGLCDVTSVKVLDKAAVPIIKLTDLCTGVKVDISFNMNNGLVSVGQIKRYQLQYPHMPRLVIAVKQFLLQRELNEVFTGGVSSYSLILMTVSFLQTHERLSSMMAGCNLGVLLIEFFELYGIKFNYFNTCIRVKHGGYAPRSKVDSQFAGHSPHNSPLCIEDPLNCTNDIGRSSYNMMRVRDAFKHAYHRLSLAVLDTGSAANPNSNSILGRVIRVTDKVVEFRMSVNERLRVLSSCRVEVTPVPAAQCPSLLGTGAPAEGGADEGGVGVGRAPVSSSTSPRSSESLYTSSSSSSDVSDEEQCDSVVVFDQCRQWTADTTTPSARASAHPVTKCHRHHRPHTQGGVWRPVVSDLRPSCTRRHHHYKTSPSSSLPSRHGAS